MGTYTDNLIPVMTSNIAPSGVANASAVQNSSNTPAWKAFDRLPSSMWATPSGQTSGWLSYQFTSRLKITKYRMQASAINGLTPKNWTFESSNDGTNWTVLDSRVDVVWNNSEVKEFIFANVEAYQTYRINVTAINSGLYIMISELEMMESIYSNKFLISSEDDDKLNSLKNNGYTNNIVPVMTSNTSPQGVASSSTFTSTREPWRAFDGELIGTANAWQATTNATTGYLSYRFVDKKVINQYAVTGLYQNPTFSPKNWTFEGSNDGISWTVLDTRSNITNWSPTAIPSTNIYTFDNNIAYYYYRINVTANGGAANLGIQELQMMEQLSPSYVYIDNKNENMFLNHGLDKNSTLELYLSMKEKKFINTTPQTIGSGKVFKQIIDTSKIPIKKASIT